MTKRERDAENTDRYEDPYDSYERAFDPLYSDRWVRGQHGLRPRHFPRPKEEETAAQLAVLTPLDLGFETTYRPGRHEAPWLLSSLRAFYVNELITDILALIRGGKEASVYRCAAHPTLGVPFLAAKVYRPHELRTMRNDAVYRRGRQILAGDGHAVKKTDHRIMRAIGKKTAFGIKVMHGSWLMHEYTAMVRLHRAGGAVPQPVSSSENAILMSYHGDGQMAAPTLNEVDLKPNEARHLFREVLRNVRLMLEQDMIHGDLSAYNILYWEGQITLIDFPQVVDSVGNDDAYGLLQRDIERVCDYFVRQGVSCDPGALTDELWQTYVAMEGSNRLADESRLVAEMDA